MTFLKTQPNALIHIVATVMAIALGILFSLNRIEWVCIIIAIGMVWLAESFNTALEFLADEVTQEKRELIGKAKDVAACGVLFASITALLVGIVIFGPYLFLLFHKK